MLWRYLVWRVNFGCLGSSSCDLDSSWHHFLGSDPKTNVTKKRGSWKHSTLTASNEPRHPYSPEILTYNSDSWKHSTQSTFWFFQTSITRSKTCKHSLPTQQQNMISMDSSPALHIHADARKGKLSCCITDSVHSPQAQACFPSEKSVHQSFRFLVISKPSLSLQFFCSSLTDYQAQRKVLNIQPSYSSFSKLPPSVLSPLVYLVKDPPFCCPLSFFFSPEIRHTPPVLTFRSPLNFSIKLPPPFPLSAHQCSSILLHHLRHLHSCTPTHTKCPMHSHAAVMEKTSAAKIRTANYTKTHPQGLGVHTMWRPTLVWH